MHFLSLLTTALAVFTPLSRAAPTPKGTLAVTNANAATFSYSTPDPFKTNWIGIYSASGGGPVNEVYVSNSLLWKYAPEAKGTLTIDVSSLAPGEYVVYFLAKDKYTWLAQPQTFRITAGAGGGSFGFVVLQLTSHNGRQGDIYKAKVGGLLIGGDGSKVTFSKHSGDGWIQVGSDGTVSGTPDRSGTASVTISATTAKGMSASIKLNIPVKRSGTALVSDLKIMTFNLWVGGTRINNYHQKQVTFLASQNVDIVGLQEASGGHPKRLADALGWFYWQPKSGDLGVLSRYPIVGDYGLVNASGGVRIKLGEKEVNFWDIHLGYDPYGPYDFCFDKLSLAQVLENEKKSGRTPQIIDTLKAMAPQIKAASSIPVIMVGDTNAPSHLDWTDGNKAKNCGYSNIPWPTSVKPAEAGLIDSFRIANPDPVSVPGNTWSPLYPFHDGATGKKEPQDRIDFIYHAGNLQVLDSKTVVVGQPKPKGAGHEGNEWTTDHAVVVTTYRI